jgi:cullin 3
MFNDMRISSELMSEYRALVKESNLKALELNATVLTSTYWPLSSLMQVSRVPEELSVACDLYQKYYLERHNGRRLTWHCNIGTADVRAFWGNKRYELTMSTFCMFVLLAFNQPQSAVLSFGDLQRITDIPENELKRTLQSLACAKYKILLKHPKGKEIDATADTFQVNTEFACANSKIRIQQIAASSKNGSLGRDQYDQDERESKAIRERVQEDRKPACDAAIIRIMKARKTLSHNELVVQVTQVLQSHFSVDPIVLKSRIEALIDRDYLKRTDDRKVYEYVA